MADLEDPIIGCLEAARVAVEDELRSATDCTSNTAYIAELATRINVINQLLSFYKVK
jgi:hypothetical protein